MESLVDIEDLVKRECLQEEDEIGEQILSTLTDDFLCSFRTVLIAWYIEKRRRMPWRGDNTTIPISAYSVWVSEVMLQQTRVETVVNYWGKWMDVFPTVSALAAATPDEVNRLWAGLGYYRRAQNLLAGARYIVEKHNGEIPRQKDALLAVPGIGPYTAGAISSIAFSLPEPVVDGNVLRVFSRLFACHLQQGSGKLEKLCWKLGGVLLDRQRPADFNQAIMELGATLCKPTNPSCKTCPVRYFCGARKLVDWTATHNDESKLTTVVKVAHKLNISVPANLQTRIQSIPRDVTFFPRKVEKKTSKDVQLLVHVIRRIDEHRPGRYLFIRRSSKGLLANQWEFPNFPLQNVKADDSDEIEIEPYKNNTLELWRQHKDIRDNYFQRSFGAIWLSESHPDSKTNNLNNESELSMLFESRKEPSPLSDPIVHIFSHERHTMHVLLDEVVVIELADALMTGNERFAWMTSNEIISRGITTGCKKILQQIEGLSVDGPVSPKKRKTIDAMEQPKSTNKVRLKTEFEVIDLTDEADNKNPFAAFAAMTTKPACLFSTPNILPKPTTSKSKKLD
jgi:A/G-specific adenine glycosylase